MIEQWMGNAVSSFSRPAVYLDHWALMTFAENEELGERLVGALTLSGGRWCMTLMSMAEICHVADRRHAEHIDRLLAKAQRFLHPIRLTEVLLQPEHYEDRSTLPPWDEGLANELALPREFCVPGAFGRAWAARSRAAATFASMTDRVAAEFNAWRKNPENIMQAKSARLDRPSRWIYVLIGELMRPAVLNASERISRQDSADLLHSLTALAYCDLALLDGKFAERANTAKRRLGVRGAHLPTAFSARGDGVESFLRALEKFGAGAHTMSDE